MKPANNEDETVNSVAYHNLASAHTPYVTPKHLQVPTDLFQYPVKVVTDPRWKGKGSKAKALANPISTSVSDLQSSLLKSNSQGILSGCNSDHHAKSNNELWEYIVSKQPSFVDSFKAYSHPRAKNWVVRSGCQYGVDFVAYHRHHPSLVHSEYGVLVFSDGNVNDRLRVWSDFQCSLRLCGSVAKTLLILHVNRNGVSGIGSLPSCLDGFSVDERTITRWSPERCREDKRCLCKS
ncbi:putative tRNA-intron lyase [Helianthus debilis subsp. tardiflorus]